MQERKPTRLSARPVQKRAPVPAPGPPETGTSDRPARIRARPEQTVRSAQERAERASSVSRTREAARAPDSLRPAQEEDSVLPAQEGDSVRPAQERALASLRCAARRSCDRWSARSTPRGRQRPLWQSIPTANASRQDSLIISDFDVNLPSPAFVRCSYVKSVTRIRARTSIVQSSCSHPVAMRLRKTPRSGVT